MKHIFFNDTNIVTNIISYNINFYIFEWHQKYGILKTEFVIEYNWKRKKPTILFIYTHTYTQNNYTHYATLKKIIRNSVTKKQTNGHKLLL